MVPTQKGTIILCNTFERKVGGAELNLVIGCARLGLKSGWISRLGNDDFGRYITKVVKGEGIDTSEVKFVDAYPASVYFREVLADGYLADHFIIEKNLQLVQ